MSRELDVKEYLDTVCDLLAQGHSCIGVPITGISMTPFLQPGDRVFLSTLPQTLHKGDLVLFTRADGRYVLHRIVAVNGDGSFLLLGDRQTMRERVPSVQNIHAIATGASHGGKMLTQKSLRWWFFAVPWRLLEPLRPHLLGLWARLGKLH